jgi:hypothetical protein
MQNENELFKIVKNAFDSFLNRHSALLDVNASERSMTHKLAEALQEVFPKRNVDCEYNRHRDLPKTIRACQDKSVRAGDLDATTVYPDIVVHTRGSDENNLLVIEVKKSSACRGSDWDTKKLKEFTDGEFHYQVGLFVEIDVEGQTVSKVKCYKDGEEIEGTIWHTLGFKGG